MIRLLTAAAALALAVDCQRPTPVSPLTPKPAPEPAPADALSCEDACRHLRALGCEAAQPTNSGEPCVAVCENLQQSGTLSLDTSCVSRSRTCDEADRCTR